MDDTQHNSNNITISGNISGSQLQFGTAQSTQSINNNFDYNEASKLIEQIIQFTQNSHFRIQHEEHIDEIEKLVQTTKKEIQDRGLKEKILGCFKGLQEKFLAIGVDKIANYITTSISSFIG